MRAAITWFNRISAGGLVLIGLGVIATGILIGMIAWSPTPIWDQWDAAAPQQLGDLLKPHNEHRIAMSRAIFWADIALGHGTGVINLAFVYIYSALNLALLVLLARWAWPKAGVSQLVAVAAIGAAFFFSGFQFENFASGFQNQFTGVFFFATAAIGSLCVAASSADPWRKVLVGVSVLSTLIGIMSMANGLLIAPLLVVLALLLGLRATAWIMLAIAVASWMMYFREYPASSSPGMMSTLLKDPVGFIDNVLAYVGGAAPNSIAAIKPPFAQKLEVARLFGLVPMLAIGGLSIWMLFRPEAERPRLAVWAAIGLFVFASAAVTALGRGDLGDEAMLASRYGAGTAALWAVVAILAVMNLRGPVLSLGLAACGGLALLLGYAQMAWIGAAQDYKMRKLDAEAALLVNADATPVYLGVYPAPERAPKVAKWLQEKSLAMYYEPWRRLYGQQIAPATQACAGEVKDTVLLAAASEPTWRVNVGGPMPDDVRGLAVTTSEGEVVGMLIRGVKGDINSTFFGKDDAPPMWGGFVHMKSANAAGLSLHGVGADGKAICRLDAKLTLDAREAIPLARPKTVGAPVPGVAEVAITGVFPLGGFNEAVGANPWKGRSWGSWGGDDKNTGKVSIAVNVEGVARVAVPFVTGPTPAGSRFEVRIDGMTVKNLPAPADLPRWSAFEIALPEGAKTLEVIAEDASREWGGWVAVGEPHTVCAENCEARACPQTFIPGEVVTGLSGGFVDAVKEEGGLLVVSGWAADTKAGEAVDHIIAVADGKRIVACVPPNTPRPDVAASTGVPALVNSGFVLRTPVSAQPGLAVYARQSDGSLAKLNGP